MTVSPSLIASAARLYRLDHGIGRGNGLSETDGIIGFLARTPWRLDRDGACDRKSTGERKRPAWSIPRRTAGGDDGRANIAQGGRSLCCCAAERSYRSARGRCRTDPLILAVIRFCR